MLVFFYMKFYIVLQILILSIPLLSSAASLQKKWDRAIQKSKIKKSELSLLLVSPDAKEIYSYKADQKRIPASLTKIITAAAVFKNMDPQTKFITQLKSDAKLKDGVLKGNLCFHAGADPAFVSENMWVLVNHFHRTGVKSIQGDLWIDASRFDANFIGQGRQDKRVLRAYDAPISAASFNWNSVNIYVRNLGDKADVYLDPISDYLELKENVKLGSKTNIKIDRKVLKNSKNQFIVTGTLARTLPEKVYYRNISQPNLWTGYNLKAFLAQRNIKLQGEVIEKKCLDKSRVMAEIESKPISQILQDMMKFSNNFVAEMLTKNMGAELRQPASMKSGMDRIHSYLKSLGITGYQLESVSGLSRQNSFRARDFVKVLQDLEQSFDFGPEFLASFPISGVDGTMKKRLNERVLRQRVRAKTGLLNRVVGLAGYVMIDEKAHSFAMIYNGGSSGNEYDARALMDELLEIAIINGV